MKYIKAENVLPKELIKIIQNHIDGQIIYIPKKDCSKKAWGENSGSRKSLKERNSETFNKYSSGHTVYQLSIEYFLSEPSIRRIIGDEKKNLYSYTI